jgi:TIGR03009 family protein
MTRINLMLTAVMVTALAPTMAVRAQQTPPPMPPAAPATEADKKLDDYLKQWDKKMQEIVSLSAKLERTEKDKTFNTQEKFAGFAQYMKVGTGATAQNLALLEMKVAGKQDIHERIVCTGTFIYQFSPADQKIYATELPPKPKAGQVGQDSFLTLIFGSNAGDMRTRFDLKLADDKTHPNGEDKYYIYVDVYPKTAADKSDFQRAQLVLNKDNYLPRRLWFETPNKSEILWDITGIDDKAKLNRADFDAPKPPPGWKLVPVERNSEKPLIIRPNN